MDIKLRMNADFFYTRLEINQCAAWCVFVAVPAAGFDGVDPSDLFDGHLGAVGFDAGNTELVGMEDLLVNALAFGAFVFDVDFLRIAVSEQQNGGWAGCAGVFPVHNGTAEFKSFHISDFVFCVDNGHDLAASMRGGVDQVFVDKEFIKGIHYFVVSVSPNEDHFVIRRTSEEGFTVNGMPDIALFTIIIKSEFLLCQFSHFDFFKGLDLSQSWIIIAIFFDEFLEIFNGVRDECFQVSLDDVEVFENAVDIFSVFVDVKE